MQRLLNFLILVLCCQVSLAKSEGNPNAHKHGLAHMNILYEAGQLFVELETPAANMLGFEYMPQNTKEWQQLYKLEHRLNRAENIIILTPSCELKNVDVELHFSEEKEAKNLQPKKLAAWVAYLDKARADAADPLRSVAQVALGKSRADALAAMQKIEADTTAQAKSVKINITVEEGERNYVKSQRDWIADDRVADYRREQGPEEWFTGGRQFGAGPMPVGSAVSDAHTDLIGSAGSRMTCCSDHSVSWPSMGLMTVGKV